MTVEFLTRISCEGPASAPSSLHHPHDYEEKGTTTSHAAASSTTITPVKTVDQLNLILRLLEEQDEIFSSSSRRSNTTKTKKMKRRSVHFPSSSLLVDKIIPVRSRSELSPQEFQDMWYNSSDYNRQSRDIDAILNSIMSTETTSSSSDDSKKEEDDDLRLLGLETAAQRSERKVRQRRATHSVLKEQRRQRKVYQGAVGVVDTESLAFRYSQHTSAARMAALQRAEDLYHPVCYQVDEDDFTSSANSSSSSFGAANLPPLNYSNNIGSDEQEVPLNDTVIPTKSRWNQEHTNSSSILSGKDDDPASSSRRKSSTSSMMMMMPTRRRSSKLAPLSPAALADVLSGVLDNSSHHSSS